MALYQIPHREARADYGTYVVHWDVSALTQNGFVMVSSFFPESQRTSERAFLVGWRAFGRLLTDPAPPIWRVMLANAHRHLLQGRWYLALLEAAFSLEAFIDSLAAQALATRRIPDFLIAEILREDDLPTTLRAVAEMRGYPQITRSGANKLGERLRAAVLTPRNSVAHGQTDPEQVDEHGARTAVSQTQSLIWDWGPDSRRWLVIENRAKDLSDLRDADD